MLRKPGKNTLGLAYLNPVSCNWFREAVKRGVSVHTAGLEWQKLPQLLQPSFFWTPWGDFFQHYCHIWETWCVILHWRSRCYFSLSLPSFLGAYTHMFHQHKTLALTFTQHIYHRGVDVRTLFLSMAQTLKEQFLLLFHYHSRAPLCTTTEPTKSTLCIFWAVAHFRKISVQFYFLVMIW